MKPLNRRCANLTTFSAINRIFAENSINISAQSLMTNDAIGYLVMDVDAGCSTVALQKLQEIDGTIRLRVLNNS